MAWEVSSNLSRCAGPQGWGAPVHAMDAHEVILMMRVRIGIYERGSLGGDNGDAKRLVWENQGQEGNEEAPAGGDQPQQPAQTVTGPANLVVRACQIDCQPHRAENHQHLYAPQKDPVVPIAC